MSFLSNLRRRARSRRTIDDLSMLDDRLLRDIGIEPRDVYDTLNRRRSSVWLAPMRSFDHE